MTTFQYRKKIEITLMSDSKSRIIELSDYLKHILGKYSSEDKKNHISATIVETEELIEIKEEQT